MRHARLVLLLPLALAACGSNPEAPPGSFTADEARELNEAAEMLDANAMDVNTALSEAR